ncbi:MAG: response regulator [Elusimicrobia bacterium]|nr:response regulator [Elusimicrobiota bacterium]
MGPESSPVKKARLLVADDEPDLLALMKGALEQEGYEVRIAMDGEQALAAIRAEVPDIAVVDLWMPLKDGFSVCRELKADPGFQHLPIIILSAAGREVENRIEGLESGADDFLTKPFNLGELLARIRMILRRTRQGLDANPLTRLPGNVMIENRIAEAVASARPFAVLYLDLNDFKAYNDHYGYDAGDRVIRATAKLLVEVVREAGTGTDFLGHIGGDDFIIVTHPDSMEALCRRVVEGFDRLSPSFYPEEDRARGGILANDRQGRLIEHPLLSIAIGVCHNRQRRLVSYGQVSQICAELKEFAKQQDGPGSRFVIDRRGDK